MSQSHATGVFYVHHPRSFPIQLNSSYQLPTPRKSIQGVGEPENCGVEVGWFNLFSADELTGGTELSSLKRNLNGKGSVSPQKVGSIFSG